MSERHAFKGPYSYCAVCSQSPENPIHTKFDVIITAIHTIAIGAENQTEAISQAVSHFAFEHRGNEVTVTNVTAKPIELEV